MKKDYARFTKEMKNTHKILVPNMLPIHFKLMISIFREYGYNMELLETSGNSIIETGLKNVHNDSCYPAILVIGQLLDALENQKYDKNKVALLISQTGGGCRASNYIYLLRKALKNCGNEQIPVISLNFAMTEFSSGFKITLNMLHKLVYAVLFGDLLMLLSHQVEPYEITKKDTQRLVDKWTHEIAHHFTKGKIVNYKWVKQTYKDIINSFKKIKIKKVYKPKVGIVGEIYVKYSPLGNNNLEEFLKQENAELVVPGLLDFCLYCVYNGIVDRKLYGRSFFKYHVCKIAYNFLTSKQKDIIKLIKENSDFMPPGDFTKTMKGVKEYINLGVKMGEGWLLTAEMIELIEGGVNNIICTQPFGCLPNHIVGKGMIGKIKEKNPSANIISLDFDASATKTNQENRIKLMLANANSMEGVQTKV